MVRHGKDNVLPKQGFIQNYYTREREQFATKVNPRQNSVKCILQHVEGKEDCHTSIEATVK